MNKIEEIENNKNIGIIVFNQNNLNEINNGMGVAKVKHLEAQVHYFALTFRRQFNDNSIIDINVPILYFNYPQEVSQAGIDFDLKEVQEMNDSLKDIAISMIDECIAENQYLIDNGYEPLLTQLHTLHSHPGGKNQSFSGTDLCKNIDEPGVIYPFANTEEYTPSFAGILYRTKTELKLAHHEYRLVNDTKYIKGRCLAFVSNIIEPSSAEKFIYESENEDKSYETTDNINWNNYSKDIVNKISFNACTEFVDNENVIELIRNTYNQQHFQRKKGNAMGMVSQMEEDEDHDNQSYMNDYWN